MKACSSANSTIIKGVFVLTTLSKKKLIFLNRFNMNIKNILKKYYFKTF